jgi:hypothetical protein
MLVCGADVLHSMADPTMWRQDLLEVCAVLCCAGMCWAVLGWDVLGWAYKQKLSESHHSNALL